jgi:hypothetical protein
VTWASYSPWTKNLCTKLRTFLQEDENTLSKPHAVLKTRLARAGKNLVHTVRGWYGCHDPVNVSIVGEWEGGR